MRSAPVVLGLALLAGPASAAPTKEECVEAHGKGQDLREKNHLVDAKKAFLTCAQSTCPALVQADCARFGDDLSRGVPSVSFAARDGAGKDLGAVKVYVDGQLTAERVDDGKSYELDPGKHVVRFEYAGKEVSVDAVLAQGERNRSVVGAFPPEPGQKPVADAASVSPPAESAPGKSKLPLVIAGIGGAAIVTGVVLGIVGKSGIPSRCSLGDHTCAGPVGDPIFSDAKSSAKLINAGFAVGGVGVAAVAAGIVWYVLLPAPQAKTMGAFSPWIAPGTGGVTMQRSF